MPPNDRESVSFITTEAGEDLIVGYALARAGPGEVVSLVLQRHPRFEMLLPPEERGVNVCHEGYTNTEGELATRITVDGLHVDIETNVRDYRIDLKDVDADEVADARKVLQQMHACGGFTLELR